MSIKFTKADVSGKYFKIKGGILPCMYFVILGISADVIIGAVVIGALVITGAK